MASILIRDSLFVGIASCFLTIAGAFADDEKARENKGYRTDLSGDLLPEGAMARLGTIRWRHNSPVFSLSFSPDGRMIASSCDDGQVHLWDRDTGKEIGRMGEEWNVARRFPTHGPYVSFSPDGKTIASSGWPKEGVELWNVAGRTSTILGGDFQSLFSTFSPDGKYLAEKTRLLTRLWDLPSGKKVHEFQDAQKGDVETTEYELAFSPDSKILASVGSEHLIRLWDVSTGKLLRELKGYDDTVAAIAFSPDGKTLVSAGQDKAIRLWDVKSGKELRQFRGHEGEIYSVAIAPDGKTLCSRSDDQSVRHWDMLTGRELKRLSVPSVNALPLSFSPDGKTVAIGGYDHIIHLWDLVTGKELGPSVQTVSWRSGLTFRSGGKGLITKSWFDDKFTSWDALTGKLIREETDLGKPRTWAISLDGKILATLESSQPGERRTVIRIFDLKNNRELRQWAPSAKVHSLALSTDGTLLAVGSEETSIVRIWNVSTGKEVRTLGQNLSTDADWFVNYLTFSPDGAILVSKRAFYPRLVIGTDPRLPSEMYFWDLKTRKELDRFGRFKNWCEWVAFSPDSKIMATTVRRSDYQLSFCELSTGNELRWVQNKKRFLTAVFSPNSRTVATGIEDGSVLLLETATGKTLQVLKGHGGPVWHLAYSEDGHLLASESSDGTALVWDLHEGIKPP